MEVVNCGDFGFVSIFLFLGGHMAVVDFRVVLLNLVDELVLRW